MRKPAPRRMPAADKLRRLLSKRKSKSTSSMRVYSNLSSRREQRARSKAEYLARLPKNPLKRTLYRMHPKRFLHYWFSRQGAVMALRLIGIGFMVLLILFVCVFAYFRKDLDKINPAELSKRVHSSTTKYYDRTGQTLLWEDTSSENRTVVKSEEISQNLKNATVALEDKDFYKHNGFSISGLMRATYANLRGGVYQGGSTLTQQLIKNVLLTDERTLARKAKELILAIEVERLYTKDQILSMYLNEVSYGGNRNGAEAAAREYFGKPAKELSLDEAALLASVPQRPTEYNPQSPDVNVEGLTNRQHITLDKMAEQGYVSTQEAEAAKAINTLDKVQPPSNQYKNIIAPHFVLEVQEQLETEFGAKLVTTGGLKVITTLDIDLQRITDESLSNGMSAVERQRGNNAAMVAVQNDTGQILAYRGSRDFNYPGFGIYNAAHDSLRQPGSSVKPFDYAQLMIDREPIDYTPGTTIADSPLPAELKYQPKNFDKGYRGPISIRQALAESRNLPAVKAAYIAGMDNVVQLMHDMGDTSYCVSDSDNGKCYLSAAIGSNGLRLDEHTNAYASLARGGVYKPLALVLRVEGPNGDVLKEWKDNGGKRVIDAQIPYMITDVLADSSARSRTFGGLANQVGFNPKGVKIAVKTGTTDESKDGWMMGYSTEISLGVWVGRQDSTPMNSTTHLQTGPMFGEFMAKAHAEYGGRYGWKSGDWFAQPAGIRKETVDGRFDLAPSWYKQSQNKGVKMTMDKISKRKATDCTPQKAREEITVYESVDPITKNKTFVGLPDGYNATAEDDRHMCSDVKPTVSVDADTSDDSITVTATKGTFPLAVLELQVNGQTVATREITDSGTYNFEHNFNATGAATIKAIVTDALLYDAADQRTFNVVSVNRRSNEDEEISARSRRRQPIFEFSPG